LRGDGVVYSFSAPSAGISIFHQSFFINVSVLAVLCASHG
jgi:hypothetical protein